MIDEKKLIEEIESYRVTVNGLRAGKGILREFEKHYKESILRIIEEQPKVGWIPCSERLPSEADFIASYGRNKYSAEFVVMIEGATRPTTLYFRKTGSWVDENGNLYKVTAWQPLPEPYNPGMVRKQTNGDRIRAMSDEELAELLYSLQYCDEKLNFCGNNKECDDILDGGGTVTDEMCKQCLVWWLQSEVEETYE